MSATPYLSPCGISVTVWAAEPVTNRALGSRSGGICAIGHPRRGRRTSRPVSRVLSSLARGAIIHLGPPLPMASCDLPAGLASGPLSCLGPCEPTWSSSGWGLPSHRSHLRCWWSLTPPFHPYPDHSGRFAFCGTVPRVAPGGRYPPPCPVEPGLSSTTYVAAIARSARPPQCQGTRLTRSRPIGGRTVDKAIPQQPIGRR